MAETPDFLLVRCDMNDRPGCPACARDILLPLSSIHSAYRTDTDRALIDIEPNRYLAMPCCGTIFRTIETEMAWADVLTLLDGKVGAVGLVQMVPVGP